MIYTVHSYPLNSSALHPHLHMCHLHAIFFAPHKNFFRSSSLAVRYLSLNETNLYKKAKIVHVLPKNVIFNLTPSRFHSIYPSHLETLWHCHIAPGNYLHIWWECNPIHTLWNFVLPFNRISHESVPNTLIVLPLTLMCNRLLNTPFLKCIFAVHHLITGNLVLFYIFQNCWRLPMILCIWKVCCLLIEIPTPYSDRLGCPEYFLRIPKNCKNV